MRTQTKNKIAVGIYFIAGLISLNFLADSVINHILGIACLVSAIYGSICVAKNKNFLF
ncbi:hypothetical protein HYV50_04625 [Candidatus Pacearchaeota archaeon]|nr:hypothetical protein [Candidatus Pacearchaeota archaeon]